MIAALLTTVFFALSVFTARYSSLYVGTQPANMGRQFVALIFLALWAHTVGQGFHGASFSLLFLSGVVGFGLGDWCLYETLARLGAPMTLLLCQCLAAPIGAITELLFLGTSFTMVQVVSSLAILAGVALAIAPESGSEIPVGHRIAGVGFGVLAAAGQGWGAVLTRSGFLQAQQSHFELDGLTAAYQRLSGGIITLALIMILKNILARAFEKKAKINPPKQWAKAAPYVLANALFGPVIGVTCYVIALKSLPSSVVLPIVATTPLVAMLISFLIEKTRPSLRAVVGSIFAVGGVALLLNFRAAS